MDTSILGQVWNHAELIVLWGLVATAVMTTILQGSQGFGLSRLSLPFLFGALVSGNHHRAVAVGFILYLLGGWMFAFLYYAIFVALGHSGLWLGAFIGFVHGCFLLMVFLPLLPHVHPRMATEYDGPALISRLEPPGFMGLNYGRRTPLTTLLGQVCYGAILGAFLHVPA